MTSDVASVLNSNGFRPGMLPLRSMKMQWTLDEFLIIDNQFVYKVKAPEKGKGAICKEVSIDTSSITNFQSYMENFDFRVMRVAFLYGRILEDKTVKVEVIYEPPQETTDVSWTFLADPKEHLVEGIASMLGLQKVGWIFAHPSRESDFYFSGPEVGALLSLLLSLSFSFSLYLVSQWIGDIYSRTAT